jgi:hypothetical protein
MGGGSSCDEIIEWLLDGDVSIQYQARRDLLGEDRPDLQRRIVTEGWGKRFLDSRNPDGSWGRGFYQPKWTSSHYTLLDLKNLAFPPDHLLIHESIHHISQREKGTDGGINPSRTVAQSDVCVNGMFLNYACYFREPESELQSVVDFVLAQRMEDGGFNCRKNRSGARHSSLHSTLSLVEGIAEYERNGYDYRLHELKQAAAGACEFLLRHRLYKSDRTGELIHRDMLRLSFPPRWKYNILRALDCLRCLIRREERLEDALGMLMSKRRPDGLWPMQAAHPGQVHFTMEAPRRPSRWNTLLALRVIRAFGPPA